jgi:photosystem I P700 chlorophyll a apoprotein A1
MVFSDFSRLWSRAGHFSSALSKGAKTTTWIWNLHSSAHDFECALSTGSTTTRKVFASNLAHIALLFFFLSGLHFHGAYFSNYCAWSKDARHSLPAVTLCSNCPQDVLNSDVGGYFHALHITSGLYQVWRAQGIVTQVHLKYASAASLVGAIISLTAAYYHMHSFSWILARGNEQKYLTHHVIVLLGLGSIAWSAHCIHIGVPINRLLNAAVDPSIIPSPQDLLLRNPVLASVGYMFTFTGFQGSVADPFLNPSSCSLFLGISSSHHLSLGVVLIMSGFLAGLSSLGSSINYSKLVPLKLDLRGTHRELSINLLFLALSSIVLAHHIYALPVYPYLSPDYATVLSLVYHHIIQAGFLAVGAAAHASIFIIRDYHACFLGGRIEMQNKWHNNKCSNTIGLEEVLNARCQVVGCLSYLSIALALHSFGLYIHNDTLQSLGRQEDMFQDNAISLKPVFAIFLHTFSLDTEVLCSHEKVVLMTLDLGTADFMVHHIHAFTIHVTLLICVKAFLYARGSRLLSSKLELGWIYPCDGPGRGGTCQLSPYDHIYLAAFWAYNSVSVVLFHYFWKMQSDVWGTCDSTQKAYHGGLEVKSFISSKHISAGDFSVNSGTINGWLRNFLWSQAAQVIQSYGTAISFMGLIFLAAHFVWAFSLMFLYSGRGYWQELIESILWAHHKLRIINVVQPRALSISQGRAVGLIHYTLGGLGCTFSFVISRMVVLN